jgi:DNA polymerase epsilon subunit 1
MYLKVSFRNTDDLQNVRKMLQPAATKNSRLHDDFAASLQEVMDDHNEILYGIEVRSTPMANQEAKVPGESCIVDLREHDIPYHLRVCIDLKLRAGLWYTVQAGAGDATITRVSGKDVRPDPVVLAFDIETTKLPLKFPDSSFDQIMMISYMIDGQVP